MIVVDRIEGDLAVVEVEKGQFQNVPLADISGRVRDGALLRLVGKDQYEVDEVATANRRLAMQQKMRGLFGR